MSAAAMALGATGSGMELTIPACAPGIGKVILSPTSPDLIAGVEIMQGALWPDDRGYFLEIARMAKARGTGARALRSILENLMLEIMFDLPERPGGQTYLITDRVVRGEESVVAQAA